MRKESFVLFFLASAFPVVPKITTPLTTQKFDLIAYIPYLSEGVDGWMERCSEKRVMN